MGFFGKKKKGSESSRNGSTSSSPGTTPTDSGGLLKPSASHTRSLPHPGGKSVRFASGKSPLDNLER